MPRIVSALLIKSSPDSLHKNRSVKTSVVLNQDYSYPLGEGVLKGRCEDTKNHSEIKSVLKTLLCTIHSVQCTNTVDFLY